MKNNNNLRTKALNNINKQTIKTKFICGLIKDK